MNFPSPDNLSASETVGVELDRLEVLEGRIKMNTPQQALALLHGLDHVHGRIQSMEEGTQSLRIAQTQFDGIVAGMQRQASSFIGDLGGVQVLREARAEIHPSMDQTWWYLDTLLAEKRKKALRRSLTIVGLIVVVLVILGVVYQRFLAPDPKSVALYNSEQSASQFLINGDLPSALKQVDQGLSAVPGDPHLLILKGVIQQAQGQPRLAAESFTAAGKGMPNREEFMVTRGQYYTMANLADQALADAEQAVQINRYSAQGYLLMGQAHEMKSEFHQAMDDYDLAYSAANQLNQPALAAIARQHTAMLYQMMGSASSPTPVASPTP